METLFLSIGWTMLFAFLVTFVLFTLALTKVIEFADRSFLKPLFYKMILEIVAGIFFLFYAGTRDYAAPYTGTWKARIDWYQGFSHTLFNYGGKAAAFTPINPRSEGTVYVFKSHGSYTAFSEWETKNGGETYSRLFVRIENFHFTSSEALERWDLTTAVREKHREFSYGPFFRYSMEFAMADQSRLEGRMVVRNESGKEVPVGSVILERNL